ncbi:MAG: hypothetical protein FWG98_14180 [Candidatus Cloacimonetes bacterium]|nr:hypothetical protein [Candidatus Cloacimonadota bacterium]
MLKKMSTIVVAKRSKVIAIILAVIMIGVMAGCASVPPAIYSLGNVEEGNYALIDVYSRGNNYGDYPFETFVNINGQGDFRQWSTPRAPFPQSLLGGEGKAFVKVTPGSHTFTMNFTFEGKKIPVSITRDVQAGLGYTFSLTAKNVNDPILGNVVEAELEFRVHEINENGSFKMTTINRSSQTERFTVNELRSRG